MCALCEGTDNIILNQSKNSFDLLKNVYDQSKNEAVTLNMPCFYSNRHEKDLT